MENERLIEEVRKRDFLYNLQHPKYIDAKYKWIAWKEIAEELGQPVFRCKSKWQSIRDTFRKYRIYCGRGAEGTTEKRAYKYAEILQFLNPHFKEKEMASSVCIDFEEASSSTSQATRSDGNAENASEVDPTEEEEISRPPREKRQASNIADLVDSFMETTSLIRNLIDNNQTEHMLFFKSLALTVSKLSLRRQQYAKEKMLRLVNRLEQENDRD